ncbi:MAG TPA: hypothetical protein VFE37_22795, partial [Chloroflexota bacterium]|nr:hypothetical protein [Chloroflexota bacterium]
AGSGGALPPAGSQQTASCPLTASFSQLASGGAPAESTPLADGDQHCASGVGSYAIPTGQVAPCQLYASASQPTTSSLAAPTTGASLATAASAAPPCQPSSSTRAAPGGSGVPACQLYPSASQPTTSTFGAANYPVTPLPATAPQTPARGALAGAGC